MDAETHRAAVKTVQADPVRNVFEWSFPLEEHFLIRAIFRVVPVLRLQIDFDGYSYVPLVSLCQTIIVSKWNN